LIKVNQKCTYKLAKNTERKYSELNPSEKKNYWRKPKILSQTEEKGELCKKGMIILVRLRKLIIKNKCKSII
jgi:hypothetical protein